LHPSHQPEPGAAQAATAQVRFATLPDGRRLSAVSAGQGAPSIVLESGFGLGMRLWQRVIPELAGWTRVVAYDRAGLGQSDPPPGVRGIQGMVDDLTHLLAALGADPPYLLAGHSFGGHIVRLFAARRPGDVAGLLLLDPQNERMWDLLAEQLGPHDVHETQARSRNHLLEHAEMIDIGEGEQELEAAVLPSVPVTVMSRGMPDPGQVYAKSMTAEQWEPWWRWLQEELAGRLGAGAPLVAPQGRHLNPSDEPHAVVAALRSLAKRARSTDR
jgi:pimeloyl-ACP methyl ester carboxylesterase